MDVALDFAVDLNLAFGIDIAGNDKVLSDDRGNELGRARAPGVAWRPLSIG